MNKVLSVIAIGVGACVVLLALLVSKQYEERVQLRGASDGLYAQSATTSTIQVGPQEQVTLFSTKTNCTSRRISTPSQAIWISFGSTTPSTNIGHFQATSTSVEYDAGTTGCGQWRAYAIASSTVTLDEFN